VFPSIDAYMRFMETNYGPSKRAREKLEAEGRYAALAADLRDLYTRLNQADDGSMHIDAEFVVCTVRLAD
jgi:hypothetical protein